MPTASQRGCCHLGGFKGPYYYLFLTEGWAESRSKFGRRDLDLAFGAHAKRACSHEISFVKLSLYDSQRFICRHVWILAVVR